MKPITQRQAKAAEMFFVVGIINFASCALISFFIGGDALNGHIENNRYFLNNHGTLTETSKAVFIYSKIHASSLFLTHPLAMLGIWVKQKWKKENEIAGPWC